MSQPRTIHPTNAADVASCSLQCRANALVEQTHSQQERQTNRAETSAPNKCHRGPGTARPPRALRASTGAPPVLLSFLPLFFRRPRAEFELRATPLRAAYINRTRVPLNPPDETETANWPITTTASETPPAELGSGSRGGPRPSRLARALGVWSENRTPLARRGRMFCFIHRDHHHTTTTETKTSKFFVYHFFLSRPHLHAPRTHAHAKGIRRKTTQTPHEARHGAAPLGLGGTRGARAIMEHLGVVPRQTQTGSGVSMTRPLTRKQKSLLHLASSCTSPCASRRP